MKIADFGIKELRNLGCGMWDVGYEIGDFALCPEPCALSLPTPETLKFSAWDLEFQNADCNLYIVEE